MKSRKIIIGAIAIFLGGVFLLTGSVFTSQEEQDEVEIQVRERDLSEIFNDGFLVERRMGVAPPEINAASVYSVYYNGNEREVLFSRGRSKRLPIASITKLMTALVVYENYDLNRPIGIPDFKLFSNVNLNDLRIFSDTTYKQVLYPLLLESNNSGAYAVATAPDDINFDDFVRMMNNRAKEAEMRRTDFYNPSGLDNVGGVNLSTTHDISLLIEEILEIPLFWEIMRKVSYDIRSGQSDLYYRVTTTNNFLTGAYFRGENPEWYDNILGGKTGFTHQAMGCLVMVLKLDDGGYLINVILGAEGREERFEEMEKLINWVYKAYKL